MTQIRLEGIGKVFDSPSGPVPAVEDVNLRIESGELFFLLGPSGCGKTTLLRMIAGLTEPTSGQLRFGERDVTHLPCEKRNTGMVFQSYALWPHMTVGQNVEFGPKMKGRPRSRRRELAAETLRLVEMESYIRRKPNQLSGGQQQRVAVARALAAEPDCLLLDEPLSNLDARLRMHMRTELRRLVKSTGATGIYVTHDQKEALSMADRVAVMKDGHIVQVANPEDLYNRPETKFVADFLGEANFILGDVVSADARARINTAAGPLVAQVEGEAPSGRVTCCVRPERITISAGGAGASAEGGASLPARVESSVYLGETRQYFVRLRDETRWKVFALATGAPAVEDGADVRLAILPTDVILLSE
jgi:iron(III) transport system ATP-binding protein